MIAEQLGKHLKNAIKTLVCKNTLVRNTNLRNKADKTDNILEIWYEYVKLNKINKTQVI